MWITPAREPSRYTRQVRPRLLVAAGGGGDAIAAAILHHQLGKGDLPAHVATFAWDRLLVDPVPGPRDPSWFDGLVPIGQRNYQVTQRASVRAPGGSLLPRLAGELPVHLYLLDPRGGAAGLRAQLADLVGVLDVDRVQIIDAGGDILAAGHEPELRSPLADALALAAVHGIGYQAEVLVAGLGLDGELTEDELLRRCAELHGRPVGRLTAEHVAGYRSVLDWHPSEVTGLLWAAATGARGRVEVRGDGLVVEVTDRSTEVYAFEHATIMRGNTVAQALASSTSLAQADAAATAICGSSELAYEHRKAAQFAPAGRDLDIEEVIAALQRYSAAAAARAIDYLTVRRIGEVLGLSIDALSELTDTLRPLQVAPYFPPLWAVRNR
jgi:hypothetical protein